MYLYVFSYFLTTELNIHGQRNIIMVRVLTLQKANVKHSLVSRTPYDLLSPAESRVIPEYFQVW